MDSEIAMIVVGILGAFIGGLVGWAGGRIFLIIICFGVLMGAFLGYRTGDRDILIIASGTGGAIAGFIGDDEMSENKNDWGDDGFSMTGNPNTSPDTICWP